MGLKILLLGGTGMVGQGVLRECLADAGVDDVLAVGRTPLGTTHPKLRETLHADLYAPDALAAAFADRDACFFCIGVSAAGRSEAEYTRETYDLTLALARVAAKANPRMRFVYVSGAGTDSTEKGRSMWARVKGRTENALLALPFEAYAFRPGYIQPLDGIRSKTRLYRAAYAVTAPLYPLLRRAFPNDLLTTRDVGRAMLQVAARGAPKRVLESRDITALAAAPRRSGA